MMDEKYDVVIIGAGAAGLAAAYELSLVNKRVVVLEARDRIGGRIHSITDPQFAQVVEAGAEFIHGKLPVTTHLIKKAGIKHHSAEGKMFQIKSGELQQSTDADKGWGKLMKELRHLKEDIPIADFLNTHFSDKPQFQESVLQFVEGYDAADAKKASSIALKNEWENEDDSNQGRIDKGYVELMNFLSEECNKKGNEIQLSSVVKEIAWSKDDVSVTTTTDKQYRARKALITIPLGVWQGDAGDEGVIQFVPDLPRKKEAATKMGFGAVIKFNIQFQNEFWQGDNIPHQTEKAGFIFSDAEVPTWWTQHPIKNGLLTGWLAGPKAFALKGETNENLFAKAVQSLAYIFKVSEEFINKKIVAYKINNWTADSFARGAYSYATLDTYWAREVLAEPVEDTLFFAGEAFYKGTATGTVESGLASGTETAHLMISLF